MKKILVFISMFLAINSALACSCVEPGKAMETFEKSNYVFSGKVLDVISDKEKYIKDIKFEIAGLYKGDLSENVVTIKTALQSATCGYPFEKGEEYFVYAYGENQIKTGLCSGTKTLANASDDTEDLKKFKKVFTKDSEFVAENENIFNEYLLYLLPILLFVTVVLAGYRVLKKEEK